MIELRGYDVAILLKKLICNVGEISVFHLEILVLLERRPFYKEYNARNNIFIFVFKRVMKNSIYFDSPLFKWHLKRC